MRWDTLFRAAVAFAFLLPGCTGSNAVQEMDAQGPDDHPLAWSRLASGAVPRTEAAVAAMDTRIYIIGGFETSPPVPEAAGIVNPGTAVVEVYDTATSRWTRAPDYPFPVHHAAAVALGGAVYVAGGFDGSGLASRLVHRLSADSSQWEPVAAMPDARAAHAAVALGDTMYVVGGVPSPRWLSYQSGRHHVEDIWAFEPQSETWTSVGRLHTPRDHLAAAALQDQICVSGGDIRGHWENTEVTECFWPGNLTHRILPPLPTRRGSLAAAALGNQIVFVGGQNSTTTFATVEALDPATEEWRGLSDLPEGVHSMGAVTIGGSLYAVYGATSIGLEDFSSQVLELRPR